MSGTEAPAAHLRIKLGPSAVSPEAFARLVVACKNPPRPSQALREMIAQTGKQA